MDTTSVACVLCRIEDDASLTPVSRYENIVAGTAAGKHQVEVKDFDFSYGLFVDGVRVGSFADGRLGYREWARRSGRLADIHSLEDRYDHDIDELMALSWPQRERVPTKSAPACDASRGAFTTCSGVRG
jgi:hypothetical protein